MNATFKADVEAQAHILRCDLNELGSEGIGDVAREMIRLFLQTGRIVDVGLQLVVGAPNS